MLIHEILPRPVLSLSIPVPYALSIESPDIAYNEILRAPETRRQVKYHVRRFGGSLYTRIHFIRFHYIVRYEYMHIPNAARGILIPPHLFV
jgi:hypothetical protein